ncbi:hypothetical protein HPP92_014376 [Vanilla planifolia]|uniref:Endoplasmic reticulum vesicle transporter C-terminal domain-containing protein n=1 Tax=Vanilla planifolia TaxID=51239 RepID=A0A835UYV7_VANPL|nr:hypothetical protein HPP92_014376 [Vanilla planifolia]
MEILKKLKDLDAYPKIKDDFYDRTRSGIERPLQKHGGRLEHGETYCGSCFGAERSDDQCCNSCEEVQEAYRNRGWGLTNVDLIDQCKREGFVQKIKEETGEGCNIKGFLEVVPTIYTNIRGQKIHSNQFSVTEHYRDGKVIFTEENKSFLHFLTSICAIIEVFLPWLASLILLCIMDNEQLRRKQSLVSTDELFATEGSLNKAFLREAFRSLQKKKLLL